jgi:3-oxoacyl-[acyl-carrier protein] reductase
MLQGKHALVTGGSRGIGRACAESLAHEGVQVTVADILNCDETVDSISSTGGHVNQVVCDVSDEDSVAQLFEDHFVGNRRLDILVHCAGIIHERPLLETSAREFDRVIAINLRGTFLVGRESLRCMSRSGAGRVILIASDMSYYGRETFSPYVASKHGVLGLMRSWAIEFAPSINVNAICPGPVDTLMLGAENMSEKWRKKEMEAPLLKRFGQPEEIAQLALYLCGSGGAYITGQGLGVNGGTVLP